MNKINHTFKSHYWNRLANILAIYRIAIRCFFAYIFVQDRTLYQNTKYSRNTSPNIHTQSSSLTAFQRLLKRISQAHKTHAWPPRDAHYWLFVRSVLKHHSSLSSYHAISDSHNSFLDALKIWIMNLSDIWNNPHPKLLCRCVRQDLGPGLMNCVCICIHLKSYENVYAIPSLCPCRNFG